MPTPIESAKNFMIDFFTNRDAKACVAYMANAVVFVTARNSYHLQGPAEVQKFLEEQEEALPEPFYVDVAGIQSEAVSETDRIVNYDLALVPVDPVRTVYCRASFVIRTAGETNMILFCHFSRRFQPSDTAAFHEWLQFLPGAFLIVNGLGQQGVRLLYENDYFRKNLGYSEKDFRDFSKKNAFFMFPVTDQGRFIREFMDPATDREVAFDITAETADGGRKRFALTGNYAYDENEGKVSYILLYPIDSFLEAQDRTLREKEQAIDARLHEAEVRAARAEQTIKLNDTIARARVDEAKHDAAVKLESVRNDAAKRLANELALAAEEKKRALTSLETDLASERSHRAAEKKEAEVKISALREQVDALTKQNAALTTQVEEEKGKAEETIAERKAFLADMQESLRKPPEAALSLIRDLEAGGLDDAQKDAAEKIREASTVMLDMVDNLLSAHHAVGHTRNLENKEFVFPALMREIRKTAKNRTKKKGIALKFYWDPQIPDVFTGDREALSRVLGNILDNAVKFTHSGGQVSFSVSAGKPEGVKYPLQFSIVDTGIGIEENALPTIFDPFTRSHEAVAGEYGGFGLGLATANSLIARMGGSIGVTSKPGVGSYFTVQVSLPAAVDENGRLKEAAADETGLSAGKTADTGAALASPATPGTPASPGAACSGQHVRTGGFAGKRILLAEDDPLNIEIIREMLERKGMVVTRAAGGQTAVRLFESHPAGFYDTVLVDYRMPGMDGLAVARTIRASEAAAKEKDKEQAQNKEPGQPKFSEKGKSPVPVIALTASAFEEDMAGSFKDLIDGSLSKPVEARKLYDLLWKLICGK